MRQPLWKLQGPPFCSQSSVWETLIQIIQFPGVQHLHFFCFSGSEEVIMESEARPKEAEPLLGENAEKCDTENASQSDAGNDTTQDSSISNGDDADDKERVDLKIIWNKNKYDLKIPIDSTGAQLKERIHSLTGKSSPQVLLIVAVGEMD